MYVYVWLWPTLNITVNSPVNSPGHQCVVWCPLREDGMREVSARRDLSGQAWVSEWTTCASERTHKSVRVDKHGHLSG